MARFYDNIEVKFEDGLNVTLTDSGIKRVDFCVSYFNLRGWNIVVDQIDHLNGYFIIEGQAPSYMSSSPWYTLQSSQFHKSKITCYTYSSL